MGVEVSVGGGSVAVLVGVSLGVDVGMTYVRVTVGVSEIVGVMVSVCVGNIAVGTGSVGVRVALLSGFTCS